MSELKQARENYDSLTKEIKALSDNVKSEKRSYSKDETTKFDEMKQNAIELQTKIADLEKFDFSESLTRSLAGEDVPSVQIGSNYNSQKVSLDDHELAIRGFLNSSIGDVSYEQQEAAQKCGYNLKSGVLDLQIQRSQYTSTDADGGFIVPSSITQKLVEERKAYGGLASLATVINSKNGNQFDYPTCSDVGNLASQVGEGGAYSNTNLVFGSVIVGNKRSQTSTMPISLELIQDASFDLIPFISRKLGERIARQEALQHAKGDSTGNNMQGLTVGASVGVTTALNSAITVLEWDAMIASVDSAYYKNASFCMNWSTWETLFQMTDTTNRYLMGNLSEGAVKRLRGFPVHIVPEYDSIGSENVVATFGDHSGFLVRHIGAPSVHILKETYLESNNAIGVFISSRGYSAVIDSASVKSLKMAV